MKTEQKMVLMTEQDLAQMLAQTVEQTTEKILKNAHKLNDDCLLTIEQTCEFMDTTRATLNTWEKKGILPCIRKGKRVFYRKSDIMQQRAILYPNV